MSPTQTLPKVVAQNASAVVGAGDASADEVTLLIARLLETSHRLEELTGGEVDSVADGVGRTTLLPRAQAELRRSEAHKEDRYRALLEAAPDAMVVVDQAGNIVLLNLQAERQFGYSRPELLGQPVTSIIPKGFAERLIADDLRSAADALDQQIGTDMELVARRKDGSEFPIEIMLSPLQSAEGVLVTAAVRDISAAVLSRQALEVVSAELERSNRELHDFATIASHDLQEPLRKIQAFGDRLTARSAGVLDAESSDYLSRMTGAAGRMQSLIDDLLQYSRVTNAPTSPRQVDLNEVVAEVVSDLEERIRLTDGAVHVGSLPTIHGSPSQMRQLFQNLISNALKFHAVGIPPEVHVEAIQRGDISAAGRGPASDPRWEITVRDSGIGFDEKHAEKIFAPFQRLHGRQTYEGTGIGLAICRRIAAVHGGTITARANPGAGATFVIILPLTAVVGHTALQA